MIVDFLLFGLIFYLSIPAVAGYVASSYGRSFWLWFTISCFLPVITHVILYAVLSLDSKPKRSKNGLSTIEDKKMNSLIGEAMESPEDKINKQIKEIMEDNKIKYP